MTTSIRILIRESKMRILPLALAAGFAAGAPLPASSDADEMHAHHADTVPSRLVEIVRSATQPFIDVNAATAASYQPAFGCISGPERGAMGVHYINGALVGDGEVDATKPEALIYEPRNGAMRLVGVEFIVDANAWMSKHNSPPMLEGQAFQFVGSPNRYGLAAFFELHVWAWRDNPNGAYVDWNSRVSCEGE